MNEFCPIEFSYSFTHPAGYTVPRQHHACYELVYYISGSGTTVIGNKTYPINPGTFTLIRPFTEHSEHHVTEGSVMFINFHADVPKELTDLSFQDTKDKVIYNVLIRLLGELQTLKKNYKKVLALELEEMIIHIDRLCQKSPPQKETAIEYAVRFIQEYHSTPIDWQNLARCCNYSYSHFRMIFKKSTGVSPNEYLLNCRLNAAKNMLTQTTLSCTKIAYQCGFPDNAKFSSYFKAKVGMSPKDYRKQAPPPPAESESPDA